MLYFSSVLGPTTKRKGIAIAKVLLKGTATSLPKGKPQSLIEIKIDNFNQMLYFGILNLIDGRQEVSLNNVRVV